MATSPVQELVVIVLISTVHKLRDSGTWMLWDVQLPIFPVISGVEIMLFDEQKTPGKASRTSHYHGHQIRNDVDRTLHLRAFLLTKIVK